MVQLLRVTTAGSVDDGKSTLVGRLLHDSKTILADELSAVSRSSQSGGEATMNLALLTDGLRAEREQGITIDVAYRYFATPRRRFIIADTPGHVQYTRNMVTGASTADVAVLLVDARKGLIEQSRRHTVLATLLGVPHLIVCINKMDLVGYSQECFDEIRAEFDRFAANLDIGDVQFVPISALSGDNVVESSQSMPWYQGTPLLRCLEELHIGSDRNLIDVRFPVQYVIRSERSAGTTLHDFRGYAGTVAAGVLRLGDSVVVLPSGFTTSITGVWGPGGRKLDLATAGQAATIEIADEIDVSRGDLLCRPRNRPIVAQEIDSMMCWMASDTELTPGARYVVQHTTRSARAVLHSLDYRLDITNLHRDVSATALALNEIGRVRLRTQQPLLFDPYRRNRETGGFVVIDEATNRTVAAGMILGEARRESQVIWHGTAVVRAERATAGATVWLTGLSASGKSSVAVELERQLVASSRPAYMLDGDNLRHGLGADLSFSVADRAENVRRTGEVAKLFADAGVVAIVSLISPYAADRTAVREAHARARLPFMEIFVDTPLEICEQRDPKGMYALARAGKIRNFTGVDDPYEPPASPHLRLRPEDGDAAAQAALVVELMERLEGVDHDR